MIKGEGIIYIPTYLYLRSVDLLNWCLEWLGSSDYVLLLMLRWLSRSGRARFSSHLGRTQPGPWQNWPQCYDRCGVPVSAMNVSQYLNKAEVTKTNVQVTDHSPFQNKLV